MFHFIIVYKLGVFFDRLDVAADTKEQAVEIAKECLYLHSGATIQSVYKVA